MTRDRKLLLAGGLALLVAWTTAADDSGGVKIGIVDLSQAVNATEEGKAAREEMNRKQRDAQQQVQPLVDQLKALEEEVKGKRYVLSDEALFAKQADALELRNKIESKLKELEGQLKIDQGRLEAPLVTKLRETVQALGKEQGFTVILERQSSGVVYSREALDITDQVTARFNKKKS
jgi:outer membrane protein